MHRRGCHFADAPSTFMLTHLLKEERGVQVVERHVNSAGMDVVLAMEISAGTTLFSFALE